MEVIITRTQKRAIALMVLCTIFTSLGQILWKLGVNKYISNDIFSLLNIPFVLGFVSYGLGAVLMLIAFRRGELSVLYPIVATSYIWVSIISPRLFPDDFMNAWKWSGVIVILISVSILGWASSRKKKEEAPHG